MVPFESLGTVSYSRAIATMAVSLAFSTQLKMNDEIFHFEILKKNSWKFWNISKHLFEIFHETFNFQYYIDLKLLKTWLKYIKSVGDT